MAESEAPKHKHHAKPHEHNAIHEGAVQNTEPHTDDFNTAHGIDITKTHQVKETLEQITFYPAHIPRKESGIYRKTHDLMVNEKDLPCWICKVRKSFIKEDGADKSDRNPMGAKQLETHHNIIEWAAANGVDWSKVAKDYPNITPLQHIAHAWDLEHNNGSVDHGHIKPVGVDDATGVPKYKEIDATTFLDGVEQMRVLCNFHHRSTFVGIHAITYPIWQLQRYAMQGFNFTPQSGEIQKEQK
jgi:hypothetical protein